MTKHFERIQGILRTLVTLTFVTVSTGFIMAVAVLTPTGAIGAHKLVTPLSAGAPNCVTTNKITVRIVGMKKVATKYFFLLAFVNNSDVSCFLDGFPVAQPVIGVTPTGATSRRESFVGIGPGRVFLSAHGGRAYSVYQLTSTSDYREVQCYPIISDGVALAVGNRRLIVPIRRFGATSVCRALNSTSIGPFSHVPYS